MSKNITFKPEPLLDYTLLFIICSLVGLGILMVISASIDVADRNFGQPFYYAIHHGIYVVIGLLAAFIVSKIRLTVYQQFANQALIVGIVLLTVIFIPGLGRKVNGSTRWISLVVVTFQVSELVKLILIIYMANYLAKLNSEKIAQFKSYLVPCAVLCVIAVLLLLEPDFGATVVMVSVSMALMFLAGAPLRYFLGLIVLVSGAFATLIICAPYRLKRITGFLHPWENDNQFDSGYQLAQALIAFGRGEWFGEGLGNSVQKLFFLPESHTDFLFSILAEELGLIGCLGVLILFFSLFLKGIRLGKKAKEHNKLFASFLAYGISVWLTLQAMINIGVNTGILPTKGLTLPFLSYGGNSLVIVLIACGILFRVHYEIARLN